MDIQSKKIVFIDLDGTLIQTASGATFPQGIRDMKFRENVFEQLQKLTPLGIFIATNQGGIELGYIRKEMFEHKLLYVIASLQEFIGNYTLVAAQYCPFNGKENPNRKPNTGMLSSMLNQFEETTGIQITNEECIMIGDASGKDGQFSNSDLRTAQNFGCDYLDIEDFLNMELPEPLYKLVEAASGQTIQKLGEDGFYDKLDRTAAEQQVTELNKQREEHKRAVVVPEKWIAPKPKPQPAKGKKVIKMKPKK